MRQMGCKSMETDYLFFVLALFGLVVGALGLMVAGLMISGAVLGIIPFGPVSMGAFVISICIFILTGGASYLYFASAVE